ncbi:MAG TPA: glycoside hydrolase family 127 protein [Phycisphaerales bacterium]|nr:glycoside hydrolase family 127 protein [Phycisphaerales bacterium]
MRTLIIALTTALAPAAAVAQESARIEAVPFTAVRVEDTFWSPRLRTNREVTIPYDFEQCERTGRIRNFAVAGELEEGGFEGIFYNDSDVYKVIEGAAYSLQTERDPELEAYLDGLIAKIAAAQEDDGYLYTQRTIQGDAITAENAGRARWAYLAHSHELYNAGHLYEAAVAHYRATGTRTLLDVALRNADLICAVFGPGEGQLVDVPGHEEIEIGLVKLYGVTADRKYLDQAKFFIDARGRSDLREIYGEYAQDHLPVVEQDEPVGHAVRAGYLYAGMADVAALTEAPGYVEALDRIWERLVSARTYLTGGIGAHRHTEGFGADYDLPNADAYNETCAAIASMLWNHRMFLLRGDSKYMDLFERTLYNAFLPGVSLSGDRFFYPNPLASDGLTAFNHGHVQRAPWFGTSCCPVNVVRMLPSLPGYVYATRGADVYVNLYVAGEAAVETDRGVVRIVQETEYPWQGTVRLTVSPEREGEFALRLRIPGWAKGRPFPSDLYAYHGDANVRREILVNGRADVLAHDEQGYAVIERAWRAGDVVTLKLPMRVNAVLAHERVEQDRGRVAIERGPLVYCFEGVDNGGDVESLVIEPGAESAWQFAPGLLGGVGLIEVAAQRATRGEDGSIRTEPIVARAIPYYAWAHREVGPMAVWMPATTEIVASRPAPTPASRAAPGASHCWPSDSVGAINDLRDPGASDDHSIPRLTWWDHKGTAEWAQLGWREPREISAVEVYWFDDTGRGMCRVPESWRVLYRRGGEWLPVEAAGEYQVERDQFCRAEFLPVKTDAVRVEVRLRQGFSGGMLEMTVE